MIKTTLMLERIVNKRRETDKEFINYWVYLFIVLPLTLGIYGIIQFFYRIYRVNAFIERKEQYYHTILDITEMKAKENNKYKDIKYKLLNLKDDTTYSFLYDFNKINPYISFLLTLITFGIWYFVILYHLNKIWDMLQDFEEDFDHRLSMIWTEIEITKYPVRYTIDPTKRRNYSTNLILCFVTLGVWFFIWQYKIHRDPNNLYPEFHLVEDTVLHTLKINLLK